MRKKSHILLAKYLADQMEVSESLQSHRKAFCLGSILPDIRPSFLTKKHETEMREFTGDSLARSFIIWQIILLFRITKHIQEH